MEGWYLLAGLSNLLICFSFELIFRCDTPYESKTEFETDFCYSLRQSFYLIILASSETKCPQEQR